MILTNRVKAEEEIRHFLKIFDESLNEIYVFDASNTQVFSCKLWGTEKYWIYYSRELKGLTTKELITGISEERFREILWIPYS